MIVSETPQMAADTATEVDEQHVVFFDGVCGLCNHTVNFLMDRDQSARLRFAPLQGVTAQQIVPEDIRRSLNTFVFLDKGRLYYRSTALSRILVRIGGFWHIMGVLLWIIPWPVRDLGYKFVASIRYRLFGKSEACRLPTPEERSRFLD